MVVNWKILRRWKSRSTILFWSSCRLCFKRAWFWRVNLWVSFFLPFFVKWILNNFTIVPRLLKIENQWAVRGFAIAAIALLATINVAGVSFLIIVILKALINHLQVKWVIKLQFLLLIILLLSALDFMVGSFITDYEDNGFQGWVRNYKFSWSFDKWSIEISSGKWKLWKEHDASIRYRCIVVRSFRNFLSHNYGLVFLDCFPYVSINLLSRCSEWHQHEWRFTFTNPRYTKRNISSTFNINIPLHDVYYFPRRNSRAWNASHWLHDVNTFFYAKLHFTTFF